jgi:hypothetical protein
MKNLPPRKDILRNIMNERQRNKLLGMRRRERNMDLALKSKTFSTKTKTDFDDYCEICEVGQSFMQNSDVAILYFNV